MDKEQLKELIQSVYDDYDFAEFNIHFVDEIEPHKVYEIKNNRINNKLKDTTMISSNAILSNNQMRDMLLYGIDVKEHLVVNMIEQTANKILTDIYKVNKKDWFYSKRTPVKIELTITNWKLYEEQIDSGIAYCLKFEFA